MTKGDILLHQMNMSTHIIHPGSCATLALQRNDCLGFRLTTPKWCSLGQCQERGTVARYQTLCPVMEEVVPDSGPCRLSPGRFVIFHNCPDNQCKGSTNASTVFCLASPDGQVGQANTAKVDMPAVSACMQVYNPPNYR